MIFSKKNIIFIFFLFISIGFLFFISPRPAFAQNPTQNYFRWYVNADSENVTDPWPAGGTDLDELATITLADSPPAQGTILRLRISLNASGGIPIGPGTQFKLQWGENSGGACSGVALWNDLTSPSLCTTDAWCGVDNPTPLDGASLSELKLSVSDVLARYEEINPTTAAVPINPGQDGEWDWAIVNNNATPNTSYCFQVVRVDASPMTYNFYPELITQAITVSGFVYQTEGGAGIGGGKTVVLKVNGANKCNGTGVCTAETVGLGDYSISNVDIDAANDVVTVFLDEEVEKAVTVTKAADTTSDISDLDLYRNVVIVRHEPLAAAITNTDLAQYDKDQDADIHFDADAGDLIVDNDHELHIWTSSTFAPGGAVTLGSTGTCNVGGSVGGKLHIDDSGVFTAGGAISIGGHWAADSDATFTHNNNAVTFAATGSGCNIATNSQAFYDLTFNGSGGGWSFSDAATISNDLTITAGTLSGNQSINVNGGDIICGASCGVINLSSASVVTLAGTGNFGTVDLDSNWTFYDLVFNGTTTSRGSGTITVPDILIIAADKSLDAGSKTWTLSGTTGAPFVLDGTLTANASTFIYNGNNESGNTTVVATTYNHLTFDNALETYAAAGGIVLNGDLNVTNGTFNLNAGFSLKGSWVNNGTVVTGGVQVVFNGTDPGKIINPGSSSFSDLYFNGSGGSWTLQNNDLNLTYTLLMGAGNLTAGSQNITLGLNFSIQANATFTKGSGTVTFNCAGPPPPWGSWADETTEKQDLGNVVINGSQTRVDLGSSVKATKVTVGADDTLNLGSYTLTLTGSGTGVNKPLTITPGGTLGVSTSTIEYTGGSDTDVTLLSGVNYYNLTINGTGTFSAETGADWNIDQDLSVTNTGTLNLGGTTSVTDDVNISGNGILDVTLAGNYQLNVTGSWNNTAGTFTARSGTVAFRSNDDATKTIATNNSAFNDVNIEGVPACLDVWTLQDAFDINGNFGFLSGGTLVQAANSNINFGGNVTLLDGITFTKASGSGLVIFDGTGKTFTDNNTVKENLGNVHVGTSPDDITLCSDTTMDSLTVNGGDTLYTNNWDLDITNSVTVNSTATIDTETDQAAVCPAGAGTTLINLGGDWTVASDGAFLAGTSTVFFDEATASNLDSGGTDGNHDFNNLTIQKSAAASVTLVNYDLDISGNLTIANADSTLDLSTYNLYVGGNWLNQGVFTPNNQTVTFDAAATGKTIRSGGTGAGKDFYNIVFDNAAGGWTILINDLTATNNFTLTNATAFDASNRTITVNGNFTNSVGGAATTWTGSALNLTKTGGGSYSINTSANNGDTYATLQVGANTDPRMWYSTASSYSINSSGSLYSMDHENTDGKLSIWGDYHTTTGQTDYWSYATDFDGTALGSPRQVRVYLVIAGATNPSVIVDDGGTLNVRGGGNGANQETIVGQDASALWNFNCAGTCNVQESTWNYLNLTGGTLTVYNTILNDEDAPDSGTLNVDWYLGDYVVDRASLDPVDTGANDITISENSGTPVATVFVWSGAGWSAGATSQTTGTGADGKIPQPGTNGAIKIREYARTSAGYTFYNYNLYITWQGSTYGEYDYYRGYGQNYITSTLNTPSGEDECISELWQRDDIDAQNNPAQAIDDPPTNGTWYNGMISGLSFTVALVTSDNCTISGGSKITTTATTIPFSTVSPENFYDGCQSLTVSSSASEGYTVTVQETDQMTEPVNNNQIDDGNCDGGGSPCSETTSAAWNTATNNGFAYCLDDITGDAAATAQPVNWAAAKQCGGGSQSFMILPENDIDNPDTADIMKSAGPIAGDNSYIGFRLSVDAVQAPGSYSTTIIYVVTPRY